MSETLEQPTVPLPPPDTPPDMEAGEEVGGLRQFCVKAVAKVIPSVLAERAAEASLDQAEKLEQSARSANEGGPMTARQARKQSWERYKTSRDNVKQNQRQQDLRIRRSGYGLPKEANETNPGRSERIQRDYTMNVDGLSEVVDAGRFTEGDKHYAQEAIESSALGWLSSVKEFMDKLPGDDKESKLSKTDSFISSLEDLYRTQGEAHDLDFQGKLRTAVESTDKQELLAELKQLGGVSSAAMDANGFRKLVVLSEDDNQFRDFLRQSIGWPDIYDRVVSPERVVSPQTSEQDEKYSLTGDEIKFGRDVLAPAKEARGQAFMRGFLVEAEGETRNEDLKGHLGVAIERLDELAKGQTGLSFQQRLQSALDTASKDEVLEGLNQLEKFMPPLTVQMGYTTNKKPKPMSVGEIFSKFLGMEEEKDAAQFLRTINTRSKEGYNEPVDKLISDYAHKHYAGKNLFDRPERFKADYENGPYGPAQRKDRSRALKKYQSTQKQYEKQERKAEEIRHGKDRASRRPARNNLALRYLSSELDQKAQRRQPQIQARGRARAALKTEVTRNLSTRKSN